MLRDTAYSILSGAGEAVNETSDFVSLLWGDGDFDIIPESALEAVEPESDHWAYDLIEGFSQFGLGLFGAGKLIAPLRIGTRAAAAARGLGASSRVARAVKAGAGFEIAGAITDFVAFDPYDQRVSDLAANSGIPFAEDVGRWLRAGEKPDEVGITDELWNRTKAAVEGGMLGLATGATIAGMSYAVRRSGIQRALKSGSIDEGTAEAMHTEAMQALEADARRLGEREALGIFHDEVGARLAMNPPPNTRTIEQAAFRDPQTGKVLPTGPAHDPSAIEDVAARKRVLETAPTRPEIEGYVDTDGNFLTRQEAQEVLSSKTGESADVVGRSGAEGDPQWVTEPDYFIQKAIRQGGDRADDVEHGEFMVDTPQGRDPESATSSQGFDPKKHDKLWHATTSLTGVRDEGLQAGGGRIGVGSGAPSEVSTTWSYNYAFSIAQIHKLQAKVGNDMIEGADEILDVFDDLYRRDLKEGVADEIRLDQGLMEDLEEALIRKRGIMPTEEDALERLHLEVHADDRTFREAMNAAINEGFIDEGELIQRLNGGLSREMMSGTLREPEDWVGIDPDDIGVVQVVAKPDADPRILPTEAEFAFRPDEIEIVPRLAIRHETQVAARNAVLYRRLMAKRGLPRSRVDAAVREARELIESGADPMDPEVYKTIGHNLGLITRTLDDYKRVHLAMLEEFGDEFQNATFRQSEGFGVTWADTEDAALRILTEKVFGENATLDDAVRWFEQEFAETGLEKGQLAAQLHAAHKASILIGQDIARVATAADIAQGAEKAVLEELLRDMMTSFVRIETKLGGVTSEVARTLNVAKLKGQTPDIARQVREGSESAVRTALEEGNRVAREAGEKLDLDDAELREMARNLRLTNGDPELIRKAMIHTAEQIRTLDPTSKLERTISFRTNMLLSGPKTQFVNAFNNLLTAFQVPLEYWWGGLRAGDREIMHYGRDLIPTFQDVSEAFQMFRKTWTEKVNVLDPTHRIGEGMDSGEGWLANLGAGAKWLEQLPGRALMSTDEFFKTLNFRSKVRADALELARRDALDQGLEGRQYDEFLSQRVYEAQESALAKQKHVDAGLAAHVGQGINERALDHARYATFTNDLEYGMGQSLREMTARHPWLRFVMPFVRTPVNLVRFAWQRTPVLNRWQRQHAADLAAGGQRAAAARARTDVGIGLYGSAIMLALSGKITGRGPSDNQLRRQWLETHQPYSVKIGDKWVSYRRLEPMATAFQLVGDFAEIVSELDEPDAISGGTAILASLSQAAVSKTFLTGLTDFFDAIGSGDEHKFNRTFSNFVTSFSPNALRQLNTAIDPYYRETRGLLDEFAARTPGWSQTLDARRNIFGERAMRPGLAFDRAWNPFTMMDPPEDANIRQALLELGKALPMPSETMLEGNIDLTDRNKWADEDTPDMSPYTRMLDMMANPPWGGPPLKEVIFDMIRNNTWDSLGSGTEEFAGGGRYRVIQSVIGKYVTAARDQIKLEYPKLMAEYIRLSELQGQSLLAQDEEVLNSR